MKFGKERGYRKDGIIADAIEEYSYQTPKKIMQYDAESYFADKREGQLQTPYSPLSEFERESVKNQFEFKPVPTNPLRAVERIDAQTNRAQAFTKKYRTRLEQMPSSPELEKTKASIDQFIAEIGVKEVDFTPFKEIRNKGKLTDATSGLHVNVSLWNDLEINVSNPSMGGDRFKIRAIHNAIKHFTYSDTLLIAPTDRCYWRFKERDFDSDEDNDIIINNNFDDIARIEWRAPSSLARHDLSALMVLSAIYAALKHPDAKWNAYSEAEEEKLKPPFKKPEAIELFSKQSETIKTLLEATADDAKMQAHVQPLKEAIITAAKNNTLAQPEVGHWLEKSR